MTSAFSDQWTVTKPAVTGHGGIVAAQNQGAARVGIEVLASGGNAVDAAIATSFALGATEPWMSGLGGGGCMIVYRAEEQKAWAIDFGMVAPKALDPADYPMTGAPAADLFGWPGVVEDRNLRGPLSVCVPTYLAGIAAARERFGSMPLKDLVGPAVGLAKEGLAVDWYAALLIGSGAADLARFETSRSVYLPNGFVPYPEWAGQEPRIVLGRLADTLSTIAADGAVSFYEGDIAQSLVKDLQALGGRLSRDDLASYAPRVLEPLAIPYRGAKVAAMPGLFAGATLARALELLADRPEEAAPGPQTYRAYARALRTAYEERLARMGGESPGPSCTSHLCVVDRHGNMVALTQTLLSLFGSKVMLPGTGVMLNNGVMWFDPRPGRPNSIGAGKRPLSNMCPVLGEADGRRFALGASGGRRILPAVLQIASFIADHGMGLDGAFAQPRIDVSGSDLVTVDQRLPRAVHDALKDLGTHRSTIPMVYPLSFACPSAVLRDLASGRNEGAAEPMQPWAGARAEA